MNTQVKSTKHCHRGFTLIELMVTISVLAILLAIAIPDLRAFLLSNRLSSDVNGFIGLVNYARSEAIVRNQEVVVCPKNNTSNACSNSQFWGQLEIQVFVDVDGSGTFNAGDILLKTIPATDPIGLQRTIIRATSTGNINRISFVSSGYTQAGYRFDIKAVGDATFEDRCGRSLCVSTPGRVHVHALGSCL